MTTGQRIAQKRKEAGLSQETLGAELGVSRQSIYKGESDTALPEIDKLVALSRRFGVTVGWLLGVEEAPETASAPDSGMRDGMHVYFPAVSREDAAARQTRDLLGRVYHGSLSLLVSAMTREETLSKAEIDELYAILDEMEAKQGDA